MLLSFRTDSDYGTLIAKIVFCKFDLQVVQPSHIHQLIVLKSPNDHANVHAYRSGEPADCCASFWQLGQDMRLLAWNQKITGPSVRFLLLNAIC